MTAFVALICEFLNAALQLTHHSVNKDCYCIIEREKDRQRWRQRDSEEGWGRSKDSTCVIRRKDEGYIPVIFINTSSENTSRFLYFIVLFFFWAKDSIFFQSIENNISLELRKIKFTNVMINSMVHVHVQTGLRNQHIHISKKNTPG